MKILIVDDSITSIRFMARFVEELRPDAEIIFAKDGSKALSLLKENLDVDFIICDYVMPELNGLQFMKNKMEYPEIKKIPSVICTSTPLHLAPDSDMKQMNILGQIHKPVSKSVMAKLIKKIEEFSH